MGKGPSSKRSRGLGVALGVVEVGIQEKVPETCAEGVAEFLVLYVVLKALHHKKCTSSNGSRGCRTRSRCNGTVFLETVAWSS